MLLKVGFEMAIKFIQFCVFANKAPTSPVYKMSAVFYDMIHNQVI